jgi:excisionase family DNA binding protein
LGLPGETAQSWRENFWTLFKAGNHTGISILHAQLLENAEMNLLQKRMWKIDSVPVYDYMSGSYGDADLNECVDVVVSTKDIPKEEMWTRQKTAEVLGISPQTVSAMVLRGQLDAVKPGRKYKFLKSKIYAYLANKKN